MRKRLIFLFNSSMMSIFRWVRNNELSNVCTSVFGIGEALYFILNIIIPMTESRMLVKKKGLLPTSVMLCFSNLSKRNAWVHKRLHRDCGSWSYSNGVSLDMVRYQEKM